jgi:hypothetical protein
MRSLMAITTKVRQLLRLTFAVARSPSLVRALVLLIFLRVYGRIFMLNGRSKLDPVPRVSPTVVTTDDNDAMLESLVKLKMLLRVAGASGAANIGAALIDVYLTNSALTSRQEYHSSETPILYSMIPESFQGFVEGAGVWADRALALGLVTEQELETILQDPVILNPLIERLTKGNSAKAEEA